MERHGEAQLVRGKCVGCIYAAPAHWPRVTGTGSFRWADGDDGLCSECRKRPDVIGKVEAQREAMRTRQAARQV